MATATIMSMRRVTRKGTACRAMKPQEKVKNMHTMVTAVVADDFPVEFMAFVKVPKAKGRRRKEHVMRRQCMPRCVRGRCCYS